MPGECSVCHCAHIGPDGCPTGHCDRHDEPVTLNHGCHVCAGRDIAILRASLGAKKKQSALHLDALRKAVAYSVLTIERKLATKEEFNAKVEREVQFWLREVGADLASSAGGLT